MKTLTLVILAVALAVGPALAQPVAPPSCEATLAAFRVLAEQLSFSRQQGEIAAAERVQRLQEDLARARAEVEILKAAATKK